MSFTDVQKAVENWSAEEQDRLAAFLTVVRLKRNPPYMEEIDRRLRDPDAANWMTLNNLKERFKQR